MNTHTGHVKFSKPKQHKEKLMFTVLHYAGKVTRTSDPEPLLFMFFLQAGRSSWTFCTSGVIGI